MDARISHTAERLVGTDISFNCTLSGNLTFTRLTGSSTQGTQITSGVNNQTLTVANIQPKDEGLYRCSAGLSQENLGCLTVSGECSYLL